jgi:hypothetical protein
MSENKAPAGSAAPKKEFRTALTHANDTFMPLIESQMEKNSLELTPYSKQCVLHAISGINAVLDKANVSWASPELDTSTISDILIKVACLRLNAAVQPREVFFELRNVNTHRTGEDGKDIWKRQVEMGIEGDGNDTILANFGRNVKHVCQIWKVHEGDDFTYPSYNGLDMTPPKWTQKSCIGKIVKIVYPVLMDGGNGKEYANYYIAEREGVRHNLLAHLNNNLMQETFGIAKKKYDATPAQKKEIAAKKQEIFEKAKAHKCLDDILDDPELQLYISPAWTEPFSRESMIERKMRNNAIKKIPKDFGNGALETMFEETTDESYKAANREIKQFANSEPIDIDIDENTGEVQEPPVGADSDHPDGPEIGSGSAGPAPEAAPEKPQEPAKAAKSETTPPPTTNKPTGSHKPPF